MADERLRIVIDAMNKASDDLKKVKKDVDGVDESLKKAEGSSKGFGESWAGVMTGISSTISVIQQVWQGLQKVYEVAREGADLLYVQDKFDRLSDSVGVTADVLMNDLREATRGVKSDAELMAGATDFMALGLANSREEVVRLTTVAGALNMNMNQLVLTLTNKTTMRFDALGVSVDGFDEKVKELEASGLSAEEAFSEAFLQQAEEQIEKVGHVADSTAGSFDRLEAATTNMSANFKTSMATIIAPAVDDLATKMQDGADFTREMNAALDEGVISQQEYNRLQKAVRTGAIDIDEAIGELGVAYEDFQDRVDLVYQKDMVDVVEDIGDKGYYAARAIRDYGAASEEAKGPTIELGELIIDAGLTMRSYNEQLLFSIASQGLSDEAALSLAYAMGLVDDNTMFAATQTDLLRQRHEDGIIDAEQYETAIANLADELERIKDRSATLTIEWHEKGSPSPAAQAFFAGGFNPVESTIGQTATGGAVSAGSPYLWQEYGYRGEAFVPSQDGYVLSRSDAARILSQASGGGGGGSGLTINMTNNYSESQLSPIEMTRLLEAAYG